VGGELRIVSNASLCRSDAVAFAEGLDVGGLVVLNDNGSARTDCE